MESPQRRLFIGEFGLWRKARRNRTPLALTLELTARCNNNCRHCYINLPAEDAAAKNSEPSFDLLCRVAEQAAEMGALWCLLTGGEPLLREDFCDLYVYLRKKGFLLQVFTNATLITERHLDIFKRFPPRDLEITVLGRHRGTHERISRRPGSFADWTRGLQKLENAGIPYTLKTMALRSNVAEFESIARFGRKKSARGFRFDPFLTLRHDHDEERNREIEQERLSPDDIAALEQSDHERSRRLRQGCRGLLGSGWDESTDGSLFGCGAGRDSITLSADAMVRPCPSLRHPKFSYNPRSTPLAEIWEEIGARLPETRSDSDTYLERCGRCTLVNLCMWCPANALLETGALDEPVDYFCEIAHCRAHWLTTGHGERLTGV